MEALVVSLLASLFAASMPPGVAGATPACPFVEEGLGSKVVTGRGYDLAFDVILPDGFAGVTVEPSGVQRRVPIWIGGRTARSLRRAVELDGDAWTPFALEPEQVRELLSRARDTEAWAKRSIPLEVGLSPEPPLDPIGDAERVGAELERHRSCGATFLNLRFRSRSPAHHLVQLEAFVEIAGASDRGPKK